MVDRGAMEGIVVRLVEQAALTGAGFRGERRGDGISLRMKGIDYPPDKPVICLAVVGIDVFKVDIETEIVLERRVCCTLLIRVV